MSKHPFHLVTPSPFPLLASASSFFLALGLVFSWSSRGSFFFFSALLLLVTVSLLWWASVVTESTSLGCHTLRVQAGLRLGVFLFIVSEVFFFVGFFWAYLHSSLAPCVEVGSLWPPLGISPVSALDVPLLNTFLLLTSGCTVTWAHHCLLCDSYYSFIMALRVTIFLGLAFTLFQGLEYFHSSFTITDSVYGSCFYLSTGFHGLHVIIGSLFLTFGLVRGYLGHFTSSRHLGFIFACWY